MKDRAWIFGSWILTRAALPLVGLLAHATLPAYVEAAEFSESVAGMWDRFDSLRYLDIAQRGYFPAYIGPAGYFPGYPVLFKLVSLGQGSLWSAVLVSNLCFLGALFCLRALLRLDYSAAQTRRMMLLQLAFPTAFLTSCVYSESAFLLFSVAAILAVRKGAWKSAVGLACLATLTRPTGGLLALVLFWERWQQGRRRPHEFASLLLIPATLIAFFAYLQHKVGSFWAYYKVQNYLSDFLGVASHLSDGRALKLEHYTGIGFLLRLLGIVVAGWALMRGSYRLYVVFSMAMAIYHTQGLCTHRFMLVLFPLFIVLEQRIPKRFYPWVVGLSFLAQWVLFALWVRGYRATY